MPHSASKRKNSRWRGNLFRSEQKLYPRIVAMAISWDNGKLRATPQVKLWGLRKPRQTKTSIPKTGRGKATKEHRNTAAMRTRSLMRHLCFDLFLFELIVSKPMRDY